MSQSQISNYDIGQTSKSWIRIDATREGKPQEQRKYERRSRRSYPIKSVSRDEAANFVSQLDDETRAAKIQAIRVAEHDFELLSDVRRGFTVLFGWIRGGRVLGLSEGFIYRDQRETQAEIALTVSPEMRRCDILKPLLARAVSELSYRGAVRCHVVLGRQDCIEARAVSELGGTVDWDAEIATIGDDARLTPSFAAFC